MAFPQSEYIAVIASLLVSIGLSYKSYKEEKNNRGRRSSGSRLSLWSIIVSLIASFTSGVTFLGKPAESYTYGVEFHFYFSLAMAGQSLLVVFFYWPVLMNLKGPSLHEYFERRYDFKVKMLVSAQFVISRILNTAIMALPPAIVMNYFSGFDFDIITIFLIGVTGLYTMIGDLRGIVLTDTFQGIVMFLTLIVLCAMSVWKVGGLRRIFEIAAETGRLSPPEPSFDPTHRLSLWVYLSVLVISPTFNQSSYQRFKLIHSIKAVNLAIVTQYAGMIVFASGSCFVGLAMYAYYYGCDPKEAQLVSSYSNLIVYWLDDVGSQIVGLRGLFIAGVTCASISTMSTNINTVATILSQELLQSTLLGSSTLDPTICVRIASIIVGVLVAATAIVFRRTDSLVELMFCIAQLEGMTSGLLLLGMIFVPANATGALSGGLSGIAITLLLALGSKIHSATTENMTNFKTMRTDRCLINATIIKQGILKTNHQSLLSLIASLSPFLYGTVSLFVTVVIGLVISYIFPLKKEPRRQQECRDPALYSPWVRKYLKPYTEVPMVSNGGATV